MIAGIIVIAANAGGAWSPIGDVTTTMLWIGGQITAMAIVKNLFVAFGGQRRRPAADHDCNRAARTDWSTPPSQSDQTVDRPATPAFERNTMFFLGLGVLLAVPAFKTITHLPPFMGVLFGLGLLWLVGRPDSPQRRKTTKRNI